MGDLSSIEIKMPLIHITERFKTGEIKATEVVKDVWVPGSRALPGLIYRDDPDFILGTPDKFIVRRVRKDV